jgi:hypothetical protein
LKPDEPLGNRSDRVCAEWLRAGSLADGIPRGAKPGWKQGGLSVDVLRPRFATVSSEKHAARTLLEIRFPDNLPGVPLLGLLQQNDPRIAKVRASDARFAKLTELIERGQANKAATEDAADFLRAVLPILAGEARFIQATLGEDSGFRWVVPPDEKPDLEKKAEDKNRPPDAPTLRRKPSSNPP